MPVKDSILIKDFTKASGLRIGVDESEPCRDRVGESEFAWIDASAGEGTTPGALPLVLIHGFTGHRDDFVEVIPGLAQKRRVLVPDLRGHGDSEATPGPYGWGFEQMVKDLVDWLDHLGIERCDLFGHSMGGMLTLRFALAHPERIRSLIFMCTAPELPETLSRSNFEIGAKIAEARGIDGLQELMEKAARKNCSESIAGWGESYWLHHRRRLRAMTPASFRGAGEGFFDSGSLVDRLKEIEAPTLVLVGEHDTDFSPGADLFEQHIPNVTCRRLPDAEHHPHQENQPAWREVVEQHFDNLR
ncbi:MAG: alpha/beta hydrolase [Myxococcales bacterium]|nr:alpha/beta hydrolase [Myxococcales bacterium]HIK86098.1 alpha/beta hydrolase [Myxococcales bacterium]